MVDAGPGDAGPEDGGVVDAGDDFVADVHDVEDREFLLSYHKRMRTF
jgi:hypothetical protein